MKSKSFDIKQTQTGKAKLNKTFDFVGFYKSAAETEKNLPEKRKADDIPATERSKSKQGTMKRERSPNKNMKKPKNEPVDISQISIDGSNLNFSVGPSTPRNNPRITSTPIANLKPSATGPKVKSIMKTTVVNEDDLMDGTKTIITKSKKRNKSVSFMVDDNEEVVVKRTKSDYSISMKKYSTDTKHSEKRDVAHTLSFKEKKKQLKKFKQERLAGKENKVGDINQTVEKRKEKIRRNKLQCDASSESIADMNETETQEKKKKGKKAKRDKKVAEGTTQSSTDIPTKQPVESLIKKVIKKKHQTKAESEEELVTKSQKKDIKPDVIAEDLENLSIGDNAHTLSSLLDEMTVADKSKHIKSKVKHKEKKKTTVDNKSPAPTDEEKVKWKKRKWNKDKKGEVDNDSLATSVIIENLPISTMLTYKKILSDHFGKYGLIKKIGIAEMYPTVEATLVFTTTINFYSDGAASQALEEDHTLLEGNQIRVKRPLPATETTLVLRTYAELNEQNVCSLFTEAGKIRNIRHLVKGKKAMSTVFVEFDGPKSVEKALKIATGVKVGGKKVHIAKFQIRTNKKPKSEDDKPDEAESEGSND